jgi:hypothetical protein
MIMAHILTTGIFLTAPDAAADPPTFALDVAPIVFNNCVECHRPGQAAPFDFTTYNNVRRKAKLIAHVTESGYMPPWKAAPEYGDFHNARSLTDDEKTTLRDWAEAGAPEGDPAQTPALPEFSSDWILGDPDLIVTMPEPFTVPAEGPDIYINFVVPVPEVPEGKYLKAFEFRSTAKTTAHHCLFALDTTGLAREVDAEEPGPGFKGMIPRLRNARFGGWAVGGRPLPFPDGVALPLPDGSDLVLEAHFHPSGKEETEQAQIALYLTDEAPTHQMVNVPVPFGFGLGMGIEVQPGDDKYEVKETFTLPVAVEVTDIMPHAHYICKEMKAWAETPDGKEVPLIHVPEWDFAWQEQYAYKQPVQLPADTVIHTWFRYDNSEDNPRNPNHPPRRVIWGPESTDEMASLAMNVVPANDADAEILRAAIEDYRIQTIANADVDLLMEGMHEMFIERMDTNGDGTISFLERMEGIKRMRKRMPENSGGRAVLPLLRKLLTARIDGDES